jgi:hypothetical protein
MGETLVVPALLTALVLLVNFFINRNRGDREYSRYLKKQRAEARWFRNYMRINQPLWFFRQKYPRVMQFIKWVFYMAGYRRLND